MRGRADFDRAPLSLTRGTTVTCRSAAATVLVPQPERLTDPHPGVVENGEQQTVPQPVAAVQDRLHLRDGQHPRHASAAPSTDIARRGSASDLLM